MIPISFMSREMVGGQVKPSASVISTNHAEFQQHFQHLLINSKRSLFHL